MAKKKQCNQCKGYNISKDLCTIKWCQPSFDDSDCMEFIAHGSSALNGGAYNKSEESSGCTEPDASPIKIVRRGGSSKSRVISVKSTIKKDTDEGETSPFTLEIPEQIVRVLLFFLLLSVVSVLSYGGYAYLKYVGEQERENIVWKARVELEAVRIDKTIQYLRLDTMAYEDRLLKLSFRRNINRQEHISEVPETMIYDEIASVVAINPSRWDSICNCLKEAETDLMITYSDVHLKPNIIIPYQELSKRLLADDVIREGLNLFVKKKEREVLQYARSHFKGDGFFSADSVAEKGDYLTLFLSYDDSKARLGESFLDNNRINPHFTDPVGDMGSILDGMLSICTRINKGVAFVYIGKRNHKVDSCKWDANGTREIAIRYAGSPHYIKQRTNQVHTFIKRIKQNPK